MRDKMILSKLREIRETRGLTQTQMSKIMRVSRVSYCNYENGINEPSLESLILVADYFHVSVDYLLGRNGYSNSVTFTREEVDNLIKANLLLKQVLDDKR